MPVRPSFFLASTASLFLVWTTQKVIAEADFKPVVTRSTAANRIAEKPDYAHAISSDVNWLEIGFESRTRYEVRANDYTSGLLSDDALMTRNLLYLGVKTALDPLRMVFELQDSRRFFSDLSASPNVTDTLEPLQAYAQLYFDNAVGDAPLSLSFGRMAFDWADRRLISRNRNRNTISAFDGIRLRLGHETAPWEIDAIAVRPVTRSIQNLDQSSDDLMLYGLAGYWRGWSPHVVLEPYWLWLDQRETGTSAARRNLHTLGLHAFGQWAEGVWDYDLSLAGQLGESRGLTHRAWAGHMEVGRSWKSGWKPRLALWLNFASGDRNATDGSNERFDPLFGASFAMYGYTGYFIWQNTISPSARLSFQPAKPLKCELMYRLNWLASDTDAWTRGGRRDTTGRSGCFVGQEIDARLVWQVCDCFDIDLAYAHLFPGDFVQVTGLAPDADFVQIAGTLRF
ncbi:MAG: alginate export family protein [Prosthecobacter sp.]